MAFNLLKGINFNCSQLTYADASFIGSFKNLSVVKFRLRYHIWYDVTICIASFQMGQQWLIQTFKKTYVDICCNAEKHISPATN